MYIINQGCQPDLPTNSENCCHPMITTDEGKKAIFQTSSYVLENNDNLPLMLT